MNTFKELRESAPVVLYAECETLRDRFAGQALQGMCASGPSREWSNDMLADEAYRLADAMMKARAA